MLDNAAITVNNEDLRALIADALELPVEDITDEAHFIDDLEVDSLSALEVMVRLEKRYGVKMEDSEFKNATSLARVRELVTTKLGTPT